MRAIGLRMKPPRLRQAYSRTRIAVPNGTPSEWLAATSRLAGSLHGRMNSGFALIWALSPVRERSSGEAGKPAFRRTEKARTFSSPGLMSGSQPRSEGRRLQVSVFYLRRDGGGGGMRNASAFASDRDGIRAGPGIFGYRQREFRRAGTRSFDRVRAEAAGHTRRKAFR